MESLKDRVAIITGGGTGIGAAIAARLALAFRCPVIPVRAERIAGVIQVPRWPWRGATAPRRR